MRLLLGFGLVSPGLAAAAPAVTDTLRAPAPTAPAAAPDGAPTCASDAVAAARVVVASPTGAPAASPTRGLAFPAFAPAAARLAPTAPRLTAAGPVRPGTVPVVITPPPAAPALGAATWPAPARALLKPSAPSAVAAPRAAFPTAAKPTFSAASSSDMAALLAAPLPAPLAAATASTAAGAMPASRAALVAGPAAFDGVIFRAENASAQDSPAPAATVAAPAVATTAGAADQLPAALPRLDSLPHIHLRDAHGRITDYTVAPGVTWHYDKPKPFSWAYHIPRDLGQFPGYAFRRENSGTLIELAASSLALWTADQAIIDWSQDFGKFIGLKAASTQKTLVYIPFRIGSANLPLEFNVPDNLNSTFYYLGDGWTHLSVATGFWVYGGLKKDNRALRTSSQLGEAIFSTGLVVQALKRSTGRQSPFVATKPRGEWHLFPSYSRYQSSVPTYDAYPTGHLATAMATVTVIAENYPEYRFVRPLGYSLMGLLGYAMLNNGVHWASDYPVGIALGYAFAKIAVRNGRTRVEAPADADPSAHGTGFRRLPRPRPWYRRGQVSPYTYGPFTGASWSIRL